MLGRRPPTMFEMLRWPKITKYTTQDGKSTCAVSGVS